MATAKAALPFLAADRPVDEALREGNRRLKTRLQTREFIALTYVRYDPKTGRFELGNAGLPDPYIVASDGRPRALSVPGPRFPLGVRREVAYQMISGSLAPGERLLLLSDGLPEAPTPAGEPLGYERFEELLARDGLGGNPDALFEAVRAATSSALADDWTVLVLERTA
jgi:sigma-B regulation protein RsbU (phosphoserine phosphatase)